MNIKLTNFKFVRQNASYFSKIRARATTLWRRLRLFPYVRALANDTIVGSERTYKFMSRLHRGEYHTHKQYVTKNTSTITENLLTTGYSEPSTQIQEMIVNARLADSFSAIDWDSPKVDRYKPWMWYCEPTFDTTLIQLTTAVAKEIANYLNGLPVLQSAYFWKSVPFETNHLGSQNWHMDNNDIRQIRFFLALNDINEKNGAIDYFPSGISREIYQTFSTTDKNNFRNKKRSDEEFSEFESEAKKILCKKGQSFYLDVGNCYHRGSRDMQSDRNVFVLQFVTPFHIDSRIFGRTCKSGLDDRLFNSIDEQLVFKYFGNNFLRSSKNTKRNSNKWRRIASNAEI